MPRWEDVDIVSNSDKAYYKVYIVSNLPNVDTTGKEQPYSHSFERYQNLLQDVMLPS